MRVLNIEPLRWCCHAFLLLVFVSVAGAEQTRSAKLRLHGGDFVSGQWHDAADGTVIRWRHPLFDRPLEFSDELIESITYSGGDSREKPKGAFAVDFFNGDRIYGDWIGGDENSFRFDCQRWGEISIERTAIRRISRWNDGENFIYNGPHPPDEQVGEPSSAWLISGAQLRTRASDSEITCDCGLEPQSTIHLELSWEGVPNFVVALGVDAGEKNDRGAARLEVWDGQLILLREMANKADVVSVQSLDKKSGSLKLTIFLDQPAGQAVAVSASGEKLADISLPNPEGEAVISSATGKKLVEISLPRAAPNTKSSIRFKNIRGALEVRRLLVLRGQDQSMMQGASQETRVIKTDGEVAFGSVNSVDGDSQEITVQSNDGPVVFPLAEIDSWYAPAREHAADTGAAPTDRSMRLVAYDSTQVSGTLQRVADQQVWIQSAAIEQSISISLDHLQSLSSPRTGSPAFTELPGREGRLELDQVSLHGALVGSSDGTVAEDDASKTKATLAWQARGATNVVGLVDGISGRIIFRDPPPPESKPTPQQIRQQRARQPQGFIGGLGAFFSGDVTVTEASKRGITLRTGDTLDAEVTGIDAEGVRIRASESETTLVNHDHVKAVDLVTVVAPKIDQEKRTRLLTVPRMLRNDPFTHVIVSTNDDFLRGRLISMDKESLHFETRLQEMSIPRSLVARIIWLHPSSGDARQASGSDATSDESAHDAVAFQVQAVRSDGTRLTFQPERLEDGNLRGRSEALGACAVSLTETDQLVLGNAIDDELQALPFGDWELLYAPDPAVLTENGAPGSGRSPGTASELVGQPAPDIQLQRLDGSDFQLEALRGRVVVLDFWASWCGPCMQAMPQIDATVAAFADQGVELVSVNLQESREQIEAALERLGITPTVVLDRDGAVAAHYHANAIPQTVVIDREGNIARLYVGAGGQFADQLRAAIEETLEP